MTKTYDTLSKQEKSKFNSAIRLLFSGDLILLEDAVKNAYNGSDYDFTFVFEYTTKYITEADLSIGVFEGPCAGGEYSSSNFADGKPLVLNFPDCFAKAVKNAGFDLVSTANNHLLDRKLQGALRTLDILDSVRLAHIGSYRSQVEKDVVKIITIGGIKFAFIAYTFGINGNPVKRTRGGDLSYLTSFLIAPESDEFEQYKTQVFKDFERVKVENPDVIIVLPHMGKEFIHSSNNYQETWFKIFIEAGANVICANHAHAVQPIYFRDGAWIISCCGNFTNSYTQFDGDASALVEVYFDRSAKTAFGISIIPLYAQAPLGKTYRALPIYDIMTNQKLSEQISVYEFKRVTEVHEIITEVMLENKLPVDMITPRYYKTKEGFRQDIINPCPRIKRFSNSEIIHLIANAKSVCFVGDSITDGSRNGGTGWYEPLMAHFDDVLHYKKAWDSGTVLTLLNHIDEIVSTHADVYVTAIGTNDVRYRDPEQCAMTAEEYTKRISDFTNKIYSENPMAKFVFIAPWLALTNDKCNNCDSKNKIQAIIKRDMLFNEYSTALENFCISGNYLYINPNLYLKEVFKLESTSKYLVDYIHPNRLNGVVLYSQAILFSSKNF